MIVLRYNINDLSQRHSEEILGRRLHCSGIIFRLLVVQFQGLQPS